MACNGKPLVLRDKGDGTYAFSEALDIEVVTVSSQDFFKEGVDLDDLYLAINPASLPGEPGTVVANLSGTDSTSITVSVGDDETVYNLTGINIIGDFWVSHKQGDDPFLAYNSTGAGTNPYTLFGWNAEFTNSLFYSSFVTSLETSAITTSSFDSTTAATSLVPNKEYVDNSSPLGAVALYSATGDGPPTGWLLCDGSKYNYVTEPAYEPLCGVIHNYYATGAAVADSFFVPDIAPVASIGAANLGYMIKYWNGKEKA